MIFHHVELFFTEYAVLSYDLHDLERVSVRQALFDEEVHDIVTARDDFVDGCCSVSEKILRVSCPYCGPVRESRHLDKRGDRSRMDVIEHAPGKAGTELRYCVRTVCEPVILVLYLKCVQ